MEFARVLVRFFVDNLIASWTFMFPNPSGLFIGSSLDLVSFNGFLPIYPFSRYRSSIFPKGNGKQKTLE